MARAQTASTPQRGILDVILDSADITALASGDTVRVPNGRYFIDISFTAPVVGDDDERVTFPTPDRAERVRAALQA